MQICTQVFNFCHSRMMKLSLHATPPNPHHTLRANRGQKMNRHCPEHKRDHCFQSQNKTTYQQCNISNGSNY